MLYIGINIVLNKKTRVTEYQLGIVEIFSCVFDLVQRIQSKCFQCANSNLTSFDFEFTNGFKYCEWKIRDDRVQTVEAASNFRESIVKLNEQFIRLKKHIYVKSLVSGVH